MDVLPTTAAPFRSAFERYERPLMRYAMRIVRDRERARDIVQDTFLRMYESDVNADDPRLASWLFTVCRNRAIDIQRREGRVSSFENPPEVPVEARGDHLLTVNEVFERARDLPERKAEVFELRYREGRSYQQIARTTGMTVSHVGVVLHDCIKQLRKNFAIVAALVLLVGAGAWGTLSNQQPAAEPSFITHDPLVIPLPEVGKRLTEDEQFYGPEPFYGPELPEEIERRRALPRRVPNAGMPMRAPAEMWAPGMRAPRPPPAAPPPHASPPPVPQRAAPPSIDAFDSAL